MAFPWLALALGGLGFLGQQSASQQQSRANTLAEQEAASQRAIRDYMLKRRQEVYDPIETGTILPALKRRAETPAAWAPQAGFWSKRVGAEMKFPTQDRARAAA